MSVDARVERAIAFLQSIGLNIAYGCPSNGTGLLPGFVIEDGVLWIDHDQVRYPGDVLHEAAHIAVVPAAQWPGLNEQAIRARPHSAAEEMMALAWSYAACMHLGFEAEWVFHSEGYLGGGNALAQSFKEGRYVGVPMLQWCGMAFDKPDEAQPSRPVYPAMHCWLRPPDA